MDISILIPTLNEVENIPRLIHELRRVLPTLTPNYEILILDGGSKDGTREVAEKLGISCHVQTKPGYTSAIQEGFALTQGTWVLTMDADLSHVPSFIKTIWSKRNEANVIICSRYVAGGSVQAPWFRKALSIFLNRFSSIVFHLPYRDISSGFRLYHRQTLENIQPVSPGFEGLLEILISIHSAGWHIQEIPFSYCARNSGQSKVRIAKFAPPYLKTFWEMWNLRNSFEASDYDERAYNSYIPMQRYWQRKRFSLVSGFLPDVSRVLDLGCGSSRIVQSRPGIIGLDLETSKLRYLRRKGVKVVKADIAYLPFKDESFDAIICSEVIEHIPREAFSLKEMKRLLKEKGCLILGTPDYGRWIWPVIEYLYGKLIPRGYADTHITHYKISDLEKELTQSGFQVEKKKSILGAEVILKTLKE